MKYWFYLSTLLLFFQFSKKAIIANPLKVNQSKDPWYQAGQKRLKEKLSKLRDNRKAKNIILFIGDGMGLSTITAARIYKGQKQEFLGEEYKLSFEDLESTALVKTYSANMQTPDSAATASAMMTGVKTKSGILGLTDKASLGNCKDMSKKYIAKTLFEIAEEKGLKTAIITTVRVTHATPAAAYAHISSRKWEKNISKESSCKNKKDIATQLIDFSYGDGLDIVLGDGLRYFQSRADDIDLISKWKSKYKNGFFVTNKTNFKDLKPNVKKVFGLFELEFELNRDKKKSPSLTEMTAYAINSFKKQKKGYIMMVEGGRIDWAHHFTNAKNALEEVIEFEKAIRYSLDHTDPKETLIIATADHDHAFAMNGYTKRGSNLLGFVQEENGSLSLDKNGNPYPILSYINGIGKTYQEEPKMNLKKMKTDNFQQRVGTPTKIASHSSTDVPLYANGPKSGLFSGTFEQNYIFHAILGALGW